MNRVELLEKMSELADQLICLGMNDGTGVMDELKLQNFSKPSSSKRKHSETLFL